MDEFIICESNKTQSGIPIEYNLRKRIKELNLPEEKIKIIDLNIPEDSDLIIEEIDIYSCSENYNFEYNLNKNNLNSLRSRVRERMQKDSLLLVLDDYDDDTVFIHSDSDEIIKPEAIEWVSSMCRQNQETIIKIPLVHLEGRADLRVYLENENIPKPWAGGMFFATKTQLKISTPTQIRYCVFNKFPIEHLTQDGNMIQDLGWHFSWMGNGKKRIEKSKSFCHYDDTFEYLINSKYNSEESQNRLLENTPEEGKIPPSGIKNTILKKYPIENLPKEIFELPRVKNFLLPNLTEFDWGSFNNEGNKSHRDFIKSEIEHGVYTKFFDVEPNDIVFDIGASVGPFTNFIINKFPKEVHCFEPSKDLFETLSKNFKNYSNIFLNCYAISNYDMDHVIIDSVYDLDNSQNPNIVNAITFKSYIENNNIKKIDFLKTDCEGGEWSIFTLENYNWIRKNVRKITGEFHLYTLEMKESFITFRDLYLKDAKDLIAFLSNELAHVEEINLWDDNFIKNHLDYCNISFRYDNSYRISKKFNTLDTYYTDPTPDSDWGVIETNKFSLKENQRKSFFVVDNFYDDPYAIREFALQQTYFPGEGAVGSRTRKQFLFEGIKERFEEIMGVKIAEHTGNGQGWKDGGINGRFQTCTAGTPLVYHCDSQQWAGMIYLTPDAPPQCGTSFFRHKETKIKHNSEINWEIGEGNKVFNQHTFLDGTPYELVDKIGNVFNRLVIFNGGLIHSASEYFGWDIPSSRLFHMFFFDEET